jgi:hypothetical protein
VYLKVWRWKNHPYSEPLILLIKKSLEVEESIGYKRGGGGGGGGGGGWGKWLSLLF